MNIELALPDGRRAQAYAYTGGRPFDPALPCVVFVHGASNDHSGWALLARWFAHHGWGVLAVDLPGHLRSPGPLLPDVEALAGWVLAVVRASGATHAAFVGHSMGSLIALECAARAGEHGLQATHLVMVGTAYPMQVSDALLATAAEAPERAMAMVNAWSIATLATKPGFPSPGTWLHGAALALMKRVQAGGPAGSNVFRHDFGVCHAYRGGEAAAARVRAAGVPAALVLGAHDVMTPPRATQALAAALQARVHTVPSGHHQMAEAPEATLAAVRSALGAA